MKAFKITYVTEQDLTDIKTTTVVAENEVMALVNAYRFVCPKGAVIENPVFIGGSNVPG